MKKKSVYILSFFALLLHLGGCAAHHTLEPVGKGKTSWNASFGGPVVGAFDTYIPIPYAATGFRHGLADELDLSGSLHLTTLAYGIFGSDLSASWYPVQNKGAIPALSFQAGTLLLASFKSDVKERFRAYPLLSQSMSWKTGKHLLYLGNDLSVLVPSPRYDKEADPVIWSPYGGVRWRLSERFSLLTELKWNAANFETDKIAVDPVPIANQGALTPLLMLEWKGGE